MKNIILLCIIILAACNQGKKDAALEPDITSEEEKLKSGIKKHPDSLLLVENLAQYYRDGGNYESALATINAALQKDSGHARLWDIKAILSFEKGDTLQAIHAFEKAVAIFPEPAYIISLGTLYAQTKNPLALEMADALLIGKKANAEREAIFIKGLFYSSVGQKQKAIELFDQAIGIDYGFMEAYREKAIALSDQQKYMEALLVLEKAVKLNNSFEEGYYYMGLNFEKINRVNDAIESYQTALLYAPDFIEAKEALARLGIKN
ncbi:MAG: tetratricopeptide repeat protein [Ferruginibacter sp.]